MRDMDLCYLTAYADNNAGNVVYGSRAISSTASDEYYGTLPGGWSITDNGHGILTITTRIINRLNDTIEVTS